MAAPRTIVVLRHGQTTHNAQGIWQGQLDSPLSAEGIEQAAKAARALAAYRPALVIASDLSRAADTGRAVAEASGAPLELDSRLREIHAGAWQGMSGSQVRRDFPEDMARLVSGADFRRGGTGECVAEVAARVADAARDALTRVDPGGCLVVATHGVAGRALAAALAGFDQRSAWVGLQGLGNCHWAELAEVPNGWRIRAWNASAAQSGASTELA